MESTLRAFALPIALVTATVTAGCDPFTTPSAYDDEQFLCGTDAFEDARDDCFADEDCGGVVNFQGVIEGRDVVVDSVQSGTLLVVRRGDEEEPDRAVEIASQGTSPYFNFELKIESLGGDVDVGGDRALTVDQSAESVSGQLEDDLCVLEIRLSVGTDSVGLDAVNGGVVEVSGAPATGLTGVFDVKFETEDDRAEGCFALRPTRLFTVD